MKKYLLHLVFMAIAAISFSSCGNKSVPNAYIGKWDMTNDEESSIQKTLEIKDGNTFVETWSVYNDEGDLAGEVEIQGRCEFADTEGKYGQGTSDNALCLVYDLESLSDPDGILEALEAEDYFKNENESYESAKNQGQVYGFQDVHINGSTLRFKGGQWKLIDEDMENLLEGSNSN